MIYLFSGQPGHYKTTHAIDEILKYIEQGRPVYVEGMRDFDYGRTGALPLEDPTKWEDLPDNSVVVIDECYRHFPNRAAQSRVPPYVEALARHRHRGFDFIFIAQDPAKQLDPFIRGLVEHHTHHRRKWGTTTAVLKTWDHFQADPLKRDARNAIYRPSAKLHALHNSATQHTVKRSIPWWVFAVVPLVAFVVWAGWHIASGGFLEQPQTVANAAAAEKAASAAEAAAAPLSVDQYIAQFQPRVTGQPWSAPAYDQAEPVARPEVYCMSSDKGCSCITEQGTRYFLEQRICRTMARYGNYNPYRDPPREGFTVTGRDDEPPVVFDADESAASPTGDDQRTGSGVGIGSPDGGKVQGR